jgi:hypothetical protein
MSAKTSEALKAALELACAAGIIATLFGMLWIS